MTPRGAARRNRGFTLIEVMGVTVILSLLLLMLPPRLDGFGSRSRLEAGANTVLSAFTGARDRAILDGHEVWLEFELGSLKDRDKPGRLRYRVVNRVRERSGPQDPSEENDRERLPQEELEMVPTTWRPMPKGVVLAGFSTEREQWAKSNPGEQPFFVRYLPDGSVRPACGVRLESIDLPPDAQRVMTILANALTGRATLVEGEDDLPPSRDASDFR